MSKHTPTGYVIITKFTPNRYGCLIDQHPEQLSDFRDASGNTATVVCSIPIRTVIAASDLLEALMGDGCK